ncbi:Putative malate/citrate symporter [Candidatus Phytoplasma australiense]|uniref:Citrate-sodium symport n=2 Tax=Phytoplasma australiense TaxID=59748 RepID=R4S1B7_PHYAS|nr:2-hydroxycarboxylate transporter family protein [Candidatus Phytoplasma australiense]AGL90589.1 Citrate-sodium symport [Strawberry lethal yellows phytoplasma (CPA) str. NZSb11]CAM12102.1 Putative malate/citrate symporter [Candidatus Phytoplasma australiense]
MNASPTSPEKKNNKKTILGFSLPVFGLIILLVLIQLLGLKWLGRGKDNFHPSTHPLITPLLIALLLAAFLQTIGKNIPILKDIGGGAILCIIVPSILFTVPIFKNAPLLREMQKKISLSFQNLSGGGENKIGFTSFFVSVLIIGSFLGMDKKLLKNSFKKFIPLILISLITGVLVVGILGYFLQPIKGIKDSVALSPKENILNAIFYIFAPLASGGITAGIIPLSSSYSLASSGNATDFEAMKSHIFPALLLGGIFSILVSGIIKKLFQKSKLSGNGKLEIKTSLSQTQAKPTPKTEPNFDSNKFITGVIAIFSIYIFSVMLRDLAVLRFPQIKKYLPDTIVFIVFVVILIKLFNLISQDYINCIVKTSQLITKNLTSTLLVILGSTLQIAKAWKHLQNVNFIITCFVCVIVVALVAGYLGKKLGYYPLEASVTAGLCTNSIGGAGNIAILSASDLMGLMPFAQIATRVGGAFVVVVASIAYPLLWTV